MSDKVEVKVYYIAGHLFTTVAFDHQVAAELQQWLNAIGDKGCTIARINDQIVELRLGNKVDEITKELDAQ